MGTKCSNRTPTAWAPAPALTDELCENKVSAQHRTEHSRQGQQSTGQERPKLYQLHCRPGANSQHLQRIAEIKYRGNKTAHSKLANELNRWLSKEKERETQVANRCF